RAARACAESRDQAEGPQPPRPWAQASVTRAPGKRLPRVRAQQRMRVRMRPSVDLVARHGSSHRPARGSTHPRWSEIQNRQSMKQTANPRPKSQGMSAARKMVQRSFRLTGGQRYRKPSVVNQLSRTTSAPAQAEISARPRSPAHSATRQNRSPLENTKGPVLGGSQSTGGTGGGS